MSGVLVVEPDAVLRALIEDRLHTAGFEIATAGDAAQALSLASQQELALVVTELELPVVPGLELIRALRGQPSTEAVPILAVAGHCDGTERVRVLRAGADELITRPLDLEELMLRVGRLTRRAAAGLAFEGRLEAQPMRDVVQLMERAERPGELLVWGRAGSGRLCLGEDGRVTAEWERQAGEEALLAIIGLKKGRFRFVARPGTEPLPGVEAGLRLQNVLMEAAWIEEELEKRRRHLPPTGRSLQLVASAVAAPAGRLASLPVAEVVEELRRRGTARLFDLVTAIDAAPQRTGLAVAWLCERGAVRPAAPRGDDFETTVEIAAAEVLDAAIEELAVAARRAGSRATPAPYLLLAEEERWEELAAILDRVPASWRPEAFAGLADDLRRVEGGTARVDTGEGSVALHLRRLAERSRPRIEAIVPVCSGVMLWIGSAGPAAAARSLVSRVEGAVAARGVLVASDTRGAARGRRILGEARRWRLVPNAPGSLLGIIRLLLLEEGS